MPRPLLLLALLWPCACSNSDPADGDGPGEPSPSSGGAPPTYGYRIVNVFPHDPQAFTQGLVYHGGYLYESTGGGVQLTSRPSVPSSLRQVEIETGRVLREHTLEPRFFGEGLALLEGRLYQLTWTSRVGFVYDLEDFAEAGGFAYASEGWGLTHDGSALIMSDGSAHLSWRDPATFAELRRVEVRHEGGPVRRLNELEWIDGEIWANILSSDRVARIDPESGAVTGWIDLSGLLTTGERRQADVLNGIARDAAGDRLFVTGKLWPWMFEIEVEAAAQRSATSGP